MRLYEAGPQLQRCNLERDIALLDKLIPMARSVLRDAQAKLDRMERKRDELILQREA